MQKLFLTRDNILNALQRLDELAAIEQIEVEIAVFGGASLILAYDLRSATRDLDAVFSDTCKEFVTKSIKQIAAENSWPEDWMNDAVKGFMSSSGVLTEFTEYSRQYHPFGLRVFIPVPEYLFAMKCLAMRVGETDSTDVSDIRNLATICNITSVEKALQVVEQFYPRKTISPKVQFGIEEIFDMTHEHAIEASNVKSR